MQKFKFKFKITGLEMEIEGTRDEVANISNNMTQQLRGMIEPAINNISDNQIQDAMVIDNVPKSLESKKRVKRQKSNNTSGNKFEKVEGLNFKTNPEKYGAPTQKWKTVDKALWILYVIQNELSNSELTSSVITATFNKHYKQAGAIQSNNVTRDLGKRKTGSEILVGENNAVNPSTWYLTNNGTTHVQKLIQGIKTNGAS